MNKEIVIASGNAGKIREFKEMLEPYSYTVRTIKDLDGYQEPEETGTTFHDNAIIKAQAVTDQFHIAALADDSGLSIDAFDGKPGVYSARWLGHDTPYSEKNRIVLEKMKGITNRGCHYTCAIAWTQPGCEPIVFEDIVEAEIADEPRGNNGFGYDPIVYYPPLQKTMAEMTKEEKNSISHRGKALRKLEAYLDSQTH